MNVLNLVAVFAFVASIPAPVVAQHAQVSSVAVQPNNHNRVWVCNRDNGTVSVIDVSIPALVGEIPVGVHPRSLAFSADSSRVFVANQRGDVPVNVNFVTPFTGSELRGSLSVISTSTLAVTTTMTNVGVEPYGVAVAPNGKYFAVSGFRSGTVKFYDAVSLMQVFSFQYRRDLSNIPPPFTMADVDSNRDGLADVGDPRGFVIRADSQRMYVTHNKSPFISVLDITLNGNGLPTAVVMTAKIKIDEYPFDPVFNPVPVQTLQSQGKPRFLEDIALSPDGSRALIPHLLHNVNHDVNFDFGPGLAGNFANRVYPALTMIDATNNSFHQLGDASNRLHNQLSDPSRPAQYSAYGRSRRTSAGDVITLGGEGSPIAGGMANFVVDGMQPGESATLFIGKVATNLPFGGAGLLLLVPRFTVPMVNNRVSLPLSLSLNNTTLFAQVLVHNPSTNENSLSNGLRVVVQTQGFGLNKMGYRAGHPSRVLYNAAGDRAVMLNRGSEDVFLYKVNGSDMELMSAFPARDDFRARAPLDFDSPMGDLPLGIAMVPDPTTGNDDALLYIINEVTRTLSVLRVDFMTGTIHKWRAQIGTHAGPDALTLSQRIGEELFEDASRPQTSGNFNNSCGSCHFEGGDDANAWQRGHGPRSTMPMYGGTRGTGLILWKGVRVNLGETGPMFHGENGGTGIFNDTEQQGLTDFHEILAIPLNPNLDPLTGQYSTTAALGKDLYFGVNTTGLNPSLRHAGCAICHADIETNPGSNPGPRFYTVDFLSPLLTSGETLGTLDPNCFSIRENVVATNIRDVNTGTNLDLNGDTFPDVDRNLDGFDDRETYAIMNKDADDGFRRDDTNSYPCPCDPMIEPGCDPMNPFRVFTRPMNLFSIPTKLGIFASGPFFHDQVAYSLRALVDPDVQALSPVYGSPAFPLLTPYPGLNKIFNDVHDVKGHEQFVAGASKVQVTLQSGTPAQAALDIEALLAYIQSL